MNEKITAFFGKCGVSETRKFHEQCLELYSLLKDFNQKVNLTRITSVDDFFCKHVADSLAVARFFPAIAKEPLTLADIGCGGGFPSLVLALAFEQLEISAVDSIGRKTAFVTQCAEKMKLKNLSVYTARARELNRQSNWQQRFDIVTARAVADSRTLWRECKNLPKPDGRFIFYKTLEQSNSELGPLRKASAKQRLSWAVTDVFALPGNSGRRLFVYSLNS